MVAGAPFLFGEGDGVTLGVSSSSPGAALGLGEGSGDSAGVGVGDEDLRFFFFGEALGEESGVGVEDDFFFFFVEAVALGSGSSIGAGLAAAFFFFEETDGLASGFSSGAGLPEAFFFFEEEGEGDFSGVGDGFGVGDFSASSFFLVAVELLRCFFGAGVGVGAKIFLILLPNDCSAGADVAAPKRVAIKKREAAILLIRRMEWERSTGANEPRAAKQLSSRTAQTMRDLTSAESLPRHERRARRMTPGIPRTFVIAGARSLAACSARDDKHVCARRRCWIATPWPSRPGLPCSSGCRHPYSRAGSSR